jgi:hypothetical protein
MKSFGASEEELERKYHAALSAHSMDRQPTVLKRITEKTQSS